MTASDKIIEQVKQAMPTFMPKERNCPYLARGLVVTLQKIRTGIFCSFWINQRWKRMTINNVSILYMIWAMFFVNIFL